MEVDDFEVLSRLRKFLVGAASNPQNFKGAVSLCNKHAVQMAAELFDCVLESLGEDVKSRRAVIGIIEALYVGGGAHSRAFKNLIEENYRRIVTASLPPDGPANWNRNAAKALKSLHGCLEERLRAEMTDMEAMIDAALGLSQEERTLLQRRQGILEQIEKDRESHKQLREACWSRPEGERDEEEFVAFLRGRSTSNFAAVERTVVERNISRFYEINGLERPTAETIRQLRQTSGGPESVVSTVRVVIIHLDEVVFNLSSLLNERDSKARHCIEDIEDAVKEVARRCFFYGDLRDYAQPHVKYYCDDDDGRSLDDYDFEQDDLAASLQSRSSSRTGERKLYRERAYRHRVAAQRYCNPDKLSTGGMLSKTLVKEYERLVRDLDHMAKGAIYRCVKVIRELALEAAARNERRDRVEIRLCYLTDEHLSLALARNLVFGLGEYIHPNALYSTTKFDTSWVLSEIQAKYGKRTRYPVLGATKALRTLCEKLGCDFAHVSSVSELILAVKNIVPGPSATRTSS